MKIKFHTQLCSCGSKFAVIEKGMANYMRQATNCESCGHYSYDEDYECYVCLVNLDEDDLQRFLSNTTMYCPHFQFNDEYKIVRKQI